MNKYLIISSIFLLTFGACTKDISRFNEQKKAAANVPAATLFSQGVRQFSDVLASPNVNTNVGRMIVQHWAATTYQDEPNYDFATRNIPQTFWTTLYRNVLANLQEAKRLIPTNTTISEGTQKNQLAMTDVMQVYAFAVLVNTFGDVPYTEALDPDNLFPKYDDAKAIYDDLFKRLDADIAALNTGSSGFAANADIIYGGNVAKWIKFANSLKMKLAMTVADAEPEKAKAAVEQANANAFTAAADNAEVQYFATTPNNNPIWADLVQSKRQDFIAAAALIDAMKAYNDPRMSLYFKPNSDDKYVGGIVGANNTYSLFAKPGTKLEDPALPALLLGYDEIEFFRAEAIERGFNIGGTAAEHYNNAIRASILYWGGTQAQADAYLAQPQVAYATATGTWREKIGVQKWIALYNRPIPAWTEIRRLDYPKLNPPAAAKSGFPNRLPYPSNEQTLNKANYTAAASKIGEDKVETKVFWDVH